MTQEPATRISPELRMLLLGVERNRLDAATVISALEQATRAMQAGDSFCLDSWLAGESGLSPEEIGELRNLVSETTPADPGLVETLLLDKPDVETLSEDPILQAGATRKAALDGHIRNMWAEESAPGPEASGFGRFSDLEFLAEGGMGQILTATDPAIKRRVAIKILRPDIASHRAHLAKFKNEFELTGQLEHPGIVPVYDTGRTDDGRVYFCMKLVKGESLAELLVEHRELAARRGRAFDPTPYLHHLLRVCDALSFAHSRGIVHRDLKPANIMVGAFGEVLVMDWGLAREIRGKEVGPAEESSDSTTQVPHDPLQTVEGSILGTPAYMAPEQSRGEMYEIDEQTDVYALGAILYDIVTGTPPQSEGSTKEILNRVGRGDLERPSVRAPEASIPAELEAMVMKAMAAQKRDRYSDAKAFQADIQAYLDGRTLEAARYNPLQLLGKWVGRNRKMCTGAAAVFLLAVGFFGFQRWNRFASNRDRALELIEKVGDVTPLTQEISAVDPSSGRERRDTPDRAAARGRAIEGYAAAANALDRALEVFSGNDAMRKLRREVGIKIGKMALGGRDYLFARQSVGQLENHGLGKEEVEIWIGKVEEVRSAVLDWRMGRLKTLLGKLGEGLEKTDNTEAGDFLLEDCVAEARAYRDPQTVKILGEDLKRLTRMARKARESGRAVTWTQAQRDRAKFICRVLGRLGLPACVKPLGEWMTEIVGEEGEVRDDELVQEAGIALCNTRDANAGAYLERARDRIGRNSNLWRQIARVLVRVPEADTESEPTTAIAYNRRGLVRYQKGDPTGAIKDYNKAIELDPKLAMAYNNRGLARKRTRGLAGAIEDFNKAIELDPKLAMAYHSRGLARKRKRDLTGAIEDFSKAIEMDPKFVLAYSDRGLARKKRSNLAGAIEDFSMAIEFDPKDAKAYNNRGTARVLKGDLAGGIEDYSMAIKFDPGFAWAYKNRGIARSNKGDLAGAIEDFNRAIELDPKLATAYNNRGNVRRAKGDLLGAIEDYNKAIELVPKNASPFNNRGHARQAKGDLDGALQDYTRAIQLNPRFAEAYINRGAVHYSQGNFLSSIADLEKAIQVAPANWRFRKNAEKNIEMLRKKLAKK